MELAHQESKPVDSIHANIPRFSTQLPFPDQEVTLSLNVYWEADIKGPIDTSRQVQSSHFETSSLIL